MYSNTHPHLHRSRRRIAGDTPQATQHQPPLSTSSPILRPSPQTGVHVSLESEPPPSQMNPSSTVWQFDEHPSMETVFPSCGPLFKGHHEEARDVAFLSSLSLAVSASRWCDLSQSSLATRVELQHLSDDGGGQQQQQQKPHHPGSFQVTTLSGQSVHTHCNGSFVFAQDAFLTFIKKRQSLRVLY